MAPAADAGGDDEQLVLALATVPGAEVGVEFEAGGGGVGVLPDFGDVESWGADPGRAERATAEKDLDPRRRGLRKEEPAAHGDRAHPDQVAGGRLVELGDRFGSLAAADRAADDIGRRAPAPERAGRAQPPAQAVEPFGALAQTRSGRPVTSQWWVRAMPAGRSVISSSTV